MRLPFHCNKDEIQDGHLCGKPGKVVVDSCQDIVRELTKIGRCRGKSC